MATRRSGTTQHSCMKFRFKKGVAIMSSSSHLCKPAHSGTARGRRRSVASALERRDSCLHDFSDLTADNTGRCSAVDRQHLAGNLQRPIASQKCRSLPDVVRLTLPLKGLVRHSDRAYRFLYSIAITLSHARCGSRESAHIRWTISRADAIHPDQMRPELDRGRLREMDYTRLGHPVTRKPVTGLNAGD